MPQAGPPVARRCYMMDLAAAMKHQADTGTDLRIRRWELNALVIEFIAFTGAAVGMAAGVLPRLRLRVWPPVLFAAAFFVLSCALLPLESVFLRVRYQRRITPLTSLLWSAFASVICGAIVYWLSVGA